MKKWLSVFALTTFMVSAFGISGDAFAAIKKSRKASVQHGYHHKKTSTHRLSSRKSSMYKVQAHSGKFLKQAHYRHANNLSAMRRQAVISQIAQAMPEYDGSEPLMLASSRALVMNQNTGEVIFAKNTNALSPIASITKLMTAMVVLDAKLPLDEPLSVSEEDLDYLKGTGSRLSLGTTLTRGEMLHLALMSSENRAASVLGRRYPGGKTAFVRAMNAKALALGMTDSEFHDSTGLDSNNISTAEDLAKMVNAAHQYAEIRAASTSPDHFVYLNNLDQTAAFKNTNALVRDSDWVIGLSKTGYISEAGRCLVMQAEIAGEPTVIVLLDSNGKYSRIGDANRIRKWVEFNAPPKYKTKNEFNLKMSDGLSS